MVQIVDWDGSDWLGGGDTIN